MSDAQRLVTEFHHAAGISIGLTPAMPDEATCVARLRLLQHDYEAIQAGFAQQNVTVVTKALADMLYSVYSTAISCGIELEPVFREVHRMNMSQDALQHRTDSLWSTPAADSPLGPQPMLAVPHSRSPRQVSLQTTDTPAGPSTAPAQASPVVAAGPVPYADSLPPQNREYPPQPDGKGTGKPPQHAHSRMHERQHLRCPRCHKNFIRRSHRTGITEHLLSWLYVYPFRCQVCAHRFRVFQFRAYYTKQFVNRRQYERLPARLPVTFSEAIKPGEYRIGRGNTTDLSLGGCFVQTMTRLTEGSLLSLEIQLTAETPVLSIEAALVRSVRPLGVGLEFLRLTVPEQERLGAFLRRLQAAAEDARSRHG